MNFRLKYPALFFLLILLLIASRTLASAQPLRAVSLLVGRSYDQAHADGFIDWQGPVRYVNLAHKDGTSLPIEEGGTSCGAGCLENVTRISNGGEVSGSFDRNVTYFEVMVAFSHEFGVGDAVLSACSATSTNTMYAGPGFSLPGFVSMPLTVPAGCRTWTLSASGGYVDFRSVDVTYVAAPPTATRTPTLRPTSTRTPTPTRTPTRTPRPGLTPTRTPTRTPLPSPTPTRTATRTALPSLTPTRTTIPTSTRTTMATNTSSPMYTATRTPTPTASRTSTSAATFTFTFTPTNTFTATATQTPTPSRTPTSSATSTLTPSSTNTVTSTVSATDSATPSSTPTSTETSTLPPTETATQTPQPTSTETGTSTATSTPNPSDTPTATPSNTVTPTAPHLPPSVSLTEHWWIWESGVLHITPKTYPIASVKLTIRDPQGRWPAVTLEFDPRKESDLVIWDQRFADGTLAPSGEYPVQVRVCDDHNLCARAAGRISIPNDAWPTITPTFTSTTTSTAMPSVTSTKTRILASPTPVLIVPSPTPSAPTPRPTPWPLWQILGLMGLMIVIASASLVDPRPKALRRLDEALEQIFNRDQLDSSQDEN